MVLELLLHYSFYQVRLDVMDLLVVIAVLFACLIYEHVFIDDAMTCLRSGIGWQEEAAIGMKFEMI